MANIDNFDLPESVDREHFKELVTGGYQAHFANNDFPDTEATPADFVADLLMSATYKVERGEENSREAILKFAAGMYPESTIGGVKTSDILEKEFTVSGNEITFAEDVESNNKDNIEKAYANILAKLNTMELPETVDKTALKTQLAELYATDSKDLPESISTEEEFVYSLLSQALKNSGMSEKEIVILTAGMYPGGTIGGQKCDDLVNGNFSINSNNEGQQYIVLDE